MKMILVNRYHPFRSQTINTTKVSASEFKTYENGFVLCYQEGKESVSGIASERVTVFYPESSDDHE
jgi:hypothetical protein